MEWNAVVRGAGICASLIVAIGAQNAFVLRQGLHRRHILPVVATCIASDVLLIGVGVAGAGAFIAGHPRLVLAVSRLGALYLTWFGVTSLRRMAQANSLEPRHDSGGDSLKGALLTTLAITYLNPHVYVDTMLLMGSVGGREVGSGRVAFVLGASAVSAAWFLLLGYAARALAPWLAKPAAWRLVDGTVGVLVLLMAGSLVL